MSRYPARTLVIAVGVGLLAAACNASNSTSTGNFSGTTIRVQNDTALQWNDIAPFFRDFSATFKGKVYTVPLDGDFQMVYYRTDLLQKDGLQPPATWDDYISIAKHFQG